MADSNVPATDSLDVVHEISDTRSISDPDQDKDHPGKKPRVVPNPFLNEVVVRNLVGYLDNQEIWNARQVCRLWNHVSRPRFQKIAVISFPDPCFCLKRLFRVDNPPKPEFKSYLQAFQKEKLPLQFDSFLFQRFRFFRCADCSRSAQTHPHEDIVQLLGSSIPTEVQGLTFVDEGTPVTYTNDGIKVKWLKAGLLGQPDWCQTLRMFPNLKELELSGNGLKRKEVHAFLRIFKELLEQKECSNTLTKLVLCPGYHHLRCPISRDTHTAYKIILEELLGLLPHLEDLSLDTHLNPGEIAEVLGPTTRNLKYLTLKKYPMLPPEVQLFPCPRKTIFPLRFPKLNHLELPSVYFQRWEELPGNLPAIKSLIVQFQPLMVSTGRENLLADPLLDDRNILETECVGLGLDFLEGMAFYGGEKLAHLTSFVWRTAHTLAYQQLRSYNIYWMEVNELIFAGLANSCPNLKRLTTFVRSDLDLKFIWKELTSLEELTFSADSSYETYDGNLLGIGDNGDIGIRRLPKLRVLRLLNDNSYLTRRCLDAFRGLPHLTKVEIRRAPKLYRDLTLDDNDPLLERKVILDVHRD